MPGQAFQNGQTLGQFFEQLYHCGVLYHVINSLESFTTENL